MDILTQKIDDFSDTQQLCDLSPTLKASTNASIEKTEIILANTTLEYPVDLSLKNADSATYKSAIEGIQEDTVILSFVDPINPGKIVKTADDLEVDSNLFQIITKFKSQFFDLHKENNTNDIMYIPDVFFIKRNGTLTRMNQWKKAAVILVIQNDDLEERMKKAMEVAKMHHHNHVLMNTIDNETLYIDLFEAYKNDFLSIDYIK